MKALVVYDSVYENTEKIAKAISRGIKGEVKVVRAGEANLSDLESINFLIIGSPTQGSRPTPAILEFLGKIPANTLKNVRVASFDTRVSTKFVGIFGYAAGRIAAALKSTGGQAAAPPEGFFVRGKEGPLKEGELERAAKWGQSLSQE